MRLSIPHILRGFVFTCACALLMLAVPPLQAQDGTPFAPTPSADGEIANVLQQSNNILQSNNATTILAILFVLLLAVFAWVAIKPTIANNTASNNALIMSANQNSSLMQENQRIATQHLEVDRAVQLSISENTHTLVILNKSHEALMDKVTDERKTGVSEVNMHTDEVIARLEQRVQGMSEKVDQALELVEKRLGRIDDTVKVVLRELQKDLHSAKDDLQSAKEDSSQHNLPTQLVAPSDEEKPE